MKLIRRHKLRENQYFGEVAELSAEKQDVLAALAKELVGVKNQDVKNLLINYFNREIFLQDPDMEGNIPAPKQGDILNNIKTALKSSTIDAPTGETFEEFGLSLINIVKGIENKSKHGSTQERILKEMIKREIKKLLRR